jgi:Zn-dependent protease with chaperone function
MQYRQRTLLVVAMAFAISASAQTKVKAGFNLFPAEQDVQIGQQSAAEAEQQLPILNDRNVDAYVNRIGARLAANAGGPQFQYRFKVVNASDINAFALPGGFIYVNRGVLDQARNEGEVAGVLAHEISHVALRHGTHQASKAYLAQAGLSILGGVLGGHVGEGAAQIINAVGGFGLNALFLKYSRDLESQADVRGSQILAASGYSPVDMINFFHTLEKVDTAKKTNFLSDHPAPPDRIARIQKEASLLKVTSNPTTNVADLRSVQAAMRRYGNAPTSQQIAQGATAQTSSAPARQRTANVSVAAPSSSYRSYTSPTSLFRVAYPSNWQVVAEGQGGVTIAPPGGYGNANGKPEIVYGAMINHYEPFENRGYGRVSLQEATSDLVNAIAQGSPYLRLVSNNAQQVKMANGTALAAALHGTDPVTGINERVTVVTRQLADSHLIYLLFISPENEQSRYGAVLTKMVDSMAVNPSASH